MMPEKRYFSGMLGGCAVGDALGFCIEGSPRKVCLDYIEEVLLPRRYELIECEPYGFGQYSDDTQLTRELLSSYVERKGFDPQHFAGRIVRLYKEGRAVGWGGATSRSAQRLIDGVPWDEAGEPPPAAGCGSAMRSGGVGLISFDDTEELLEVATTQSIITHRDVRAQAGSVCVAFAVGFVLVEKSFSRGELIDAALEPVEKVDTGFAHGLFKLKQYVAVEPEKALPLIATEGGGAVEGEGLSPFVVPTVLWALYSFLRSPDDYLETIHTALGCGGDVDSTAAMAGAMSGAYLGEECLPEDVTERLTDQGEWEWQDLKELSYRVWHVKKELGGGRSKDDA